MAELSQLTISKQLALKSKQLALLRAIRVVATSWLKNARFGGQANAKAAAFCSASLPFCSFERCGFSQSAAVGSVADRTAGGNYAAPRRRSTKRLAFTAVIEKH